MGIIASDSIVIDGISVEFDLIDLYIEVVPNNHGKAQISIRVRDEEKIKNIIKSIKDKMITISSTESGNTGTLFKGYMTKCSINMAKGSGIANIELISTSVKLDEEYQYESYQDKDDSYGNIIKVVAAKSKGTNSYCDEKMSSQTIKKPIIQYRETNWEFVKRMASRYRLPVIVDETADKPTFTVGYKKEGSAAQEDFSKAGAVEFVKMLDYCTRKLNEEESKVTRKDYNGICLRSFNNFNIGSTVSVDGKSYIICAKKVIFQNAHLVFIYETGSEKLYGLEPIYNESLKGRCLEGKVVKTREEYIKLQLALDEKEKPESQLYEFKWKPEVGNLMYTMPEIDTIVSLYVGGTDEGDAIVINSLRKDEGEDTDNPDNKYYTTAKGKRMYLKEKETGFSNDSKDNGDIYVNVKDKEGITFGSGKKIYVEAEGDINIISGNKLTVSGNKLVQTDNDSNGLKINKNIDIIGSKISFDFGGAAPEKEETIEKITIKNVGQSASGKELTEKHLIEINEMFRGDQFKPENSFNASVPETLKSDLLDLNKNCTCMFEENLDGELKNNDKYLARLNDEEVELLETLNGTRHSVPAVTENTIMQKVIGQGAYDDYMIGELDRNTGIRGKKKRTVGGCISRAQDAAPYTANCEQAYHVLRLDYGNSEYTQMVKDKESIYVLRCTCDNRPTNDDYMLVDEAHPWNNPPCTGQGFVGDEDNLIPEYTYTYEDALNGKPITNGAIFKIDADGKEYLAAYWNKRKGHFVEVRGKR